MTNFIHPLQQVAGQAVPNQRTTKETNAPFKEMLNEVTAPDMKVSKHAKQRLTERNIRITDENWRTISEKVGEAKRKGVTDALVVLDDAALVVSAKNNTVVTALPQDEATEKVFTNINGTILI